MIKRVAVSILFIFVIVVLFGCIKFEQPKSEVTITTDKTEYEQGEVVNITVRNGLDKSIWYYYFSCAYPWWGLEMKEDGNWQAKEVTIQTLVEFEGEFWECLYCGLPPESIEEEIYELKPGSEISDAWNLKDCQPDLAFIEPGSYRLIFKYGFSKEYDAVTKEIVYSNTFTVKGDEEVRAW